MEMEIENNRIVKSFAYRGICLTMLYSCFPNIIIFFFSLLDYLLSFTNNNVIENLDL